MTASFTHCSCTLQKPALGVAILSQPSKYHASLDMSLWSEGRETQGVHGGLCIWILSHTMQAAATTANCLQPNVQFLDCHSPFSPPPHPWLLIVCQHQTNHRKPIVDHTFSIKALPKPPITIPETTLCLTLGLPEIPNHKKDVSSCLDPPLPTGRLRSSYSHSNCTNYYAHPNSPCQQLRSPCPRSTGHKPHKYL